VRGDKRDLLGRCVPVKCVHRLLGGDVGDGDGWTDQRRSYVTASRWNVQLSAAAVMCRRRLQLLQLLFRRFPRTRAAQVLNLAAVSLQR